jgi:hypothetical protein
MEKNDATWTSAGRRTSQFGKYSVKHTCEAISDIVDSAYQA